MKLKQCSQNMPFLEIMFRLVKIILMALKLLIVTSTTQTAERLSIYLDIEILVNIFSPHSFCIKKPSSLFMQTVNSYYSQLLQK